MHQDNNLNVIKNDKDEQLVKQKVNPIISQIQRESDKEFKKFSEEFMDDDYLLYKLKMETEKLREFFKEWAK